MVSQVSNRRPAELDDPAWLAEKYVADDLTTRQIAEQLGCGDATVKRAVRELRSQLSRPRGRRPEVR
jgi:DNA-binding transcriptional regulator LsrR (DeoR family)